MNAYGYRFVRRSDTQMAHLEVDQAQAWVVRQMYRWLVEEHMSTRGIAQRLTEMGVPTARGHPSGSPRRWTACCATRPTRAASSLSGSSRPCPPGGSPKTPTARRARPARSRAQRRSGYSSMSLTSWTWGHGRRRKRSYGTMPFTRGATTSGISTCCAASSGAPAAEAPTLGRSSTTSASTAAAGQTRPSPPSGGDARREPSGQALWRRPCGLRWWMRSRAPMCWYRSTGDARRGRRHRKASRWIGDT